MYYPILLASLGFFVNTAFSKASLDKLLVISYDGFRYDYLNLNITPYLNSLKKSSTYAKCLLNVFPTQTYVNHFSLATGLYSEVHGVIGNSVYDKQKGKVLGYSYDLFHYNKDVVPIWTLNERAGEGRHSGVMMWTGGEYEYGGVNVTFSQPFNDSMTWKETADKALSWFRHPKTPANLVMIYFDEPDSESHSSGPATISERTREQVKKTDNITRYIMNNLKSNGLQDVNVVLLSDHGMEGINDDYIINLTMFVGNRTNMYGNSPVLQIYPKEGEDVQKIYKILKSAANKNKHFKVYLKKGIPSHFHIKNCNRTAPIIAVANPPYGFQDYYKSIQWQIDNHGASPTGVYGIHGYDPRTVNMHPYFIAHGPKFKKNYAAGVLKTVDMYPLFAHILNLKSPSLKPNGSFSGVKKIFQHKGLYSGAHGVIGNTVFNPKTGKLMGYGYDLFNYNKDITPIWTLNQKAGKGRHSGVMMWPGSQFPYSGITPTFVKVFDRNTSWENRISTAVSWFLHPKTPANLVMVYFEEPDDEEHTSGPGSSQTLERLKRVDKITENIFKSLKDNSLTDVNVVLLSDHGMEGVTFDRMIDLTKFVGDKAAMYGTSPVLHIYPNKGQSLQNVYTKLNDAAVKNKHFKVYLKENIPEHFYIKDCLRTGPILAVAEPTYAFQDYYDAIDWQIKNKGAPRNGTYGIHGYDPQSINMRPYFMAHGPKFKENFNAGELKMIDMYPLFATILQLELPPLKPNGTLAGIQTILKSRIR